MPSMDFKHGIENVPLNLGYMRNKEGKWNFHEKAMDYSNDFSSLIWGLHTLPAMYPKLEWLPLNRGLWLNTVLSKDSFKNYN